MPGGYPAGSDGCRAGPLSCYICAVATLLPRANLNEQVYDTLKRRILAREHGPGEKLSLHELATELGVSRSPVHHALTGLVSGGVLRVQARRGYYGTAVSRRAGR